MNELFTDLATSLVSRSSVRDSFRDAHLRLVAQRLSDAIELGFEPPTVNWPEILTWASVLSRSGSDDHVELALIASISALLTTPEDSPLIREAAKKILEASWNAPTVNLAQQRGLTSSEKGRQSSIPTIMSQHRQRLQSIIFDDLQGTVITATPFQRRTWDAFENGADTALSAPTSAGKSYILMQWIMSLVHSQKPPPMLAYLVPSRALIQQVSNRLVELARSYALRPRIISLPTLFTKDESRATLLIMTQERLERLLVTEGEEFAPDVLVVDEAHKLGESSRGVLLQRVIDESLTRKNSCRVILAAPHAEGTDLLLPRGPSSNGVGGTISDSRPTVLQNLVWLSPVPGRGRRWKVELIQDGQPTLIGQVALQQNATTKKKRFAELAFQLGGRTGGNIVFANGPAEAEEIANLIADHFELRGEHPTDDTEITALIKLTKEYIHPSYPIAHSLRYCVGAHYGDMPEIARREQERLFDQGKIGFLVCTATLLEGVNLPCRNLFVWGPRQGPGRPMSMHAFWNLAGRAGRWGREFAGTIYCLNVHNSSEWPNGAPRKRINQSVQHAGSQVLKQLSEFESFTRSQNLVEASKQNRYFEHILGELVVAELGHGSIRSIGWVDRTDSRAFERLERIVQQTVSACNAPSALLIRHSSINALLISRFLDYLNSLSADRAESLLPMSPEMEAAPAVLANNMELCDRFLGSNFGNATQRNYKANLTAQWIRGVPLAKIIRSRIEYLRKSGRTFRVPTEIRSIIGLINENARYFVPKYLACYSDCVSQWFASNNREDLIEEVRNISDLLETGVSERTTLTLVGLGLSRTAAVAVASKIPASDLGVDAAVDWLRRRDLDALDLSSVIIGEIAKALDSVEYR